MISKLLNIIFFLAIITLSIGLSNKNFLKLDQSVKNSTVSSTSNHTDAGNTTITTTTRTITRTFTTFSNGTNITQVFVNGTNLNATVARLVNVTRGPIKQLKLCLSALKTKTLK